MVELADVGLKDHLFISYASEDEFFAEWLTLKLTSEGYRVWCSKFKLLGGESYPKDIDKAIKERTYRLLAIMSHSSVSKDNCVKERTTALNIGKERKTDFLIPLNLDGLKPTELDWMTSDITFIQFNESWVSGWKQLLKKLESIETPILLSSGREIVSRMCLENNLYNDTPETFISNCLPIIQIPKKVKRYEFTTKVTKFGLAPLMREWAFWRIGKYAFSFNTPSTDLCERYSMRYTDDFLWENFESILDIPTSNMIIHLLRRSIQVKCFTKGLDLSSYYDDLFFFPNSLIKDGKIHNMRFEGDWSFISICGTRTIRKYIEGKSVAITYPYYLGVRPRIRMSDPFGHYLMLIIGVYVTDSEGNMVRGRSQVTRTRKILSSWHNKEILSRQMAIAQFLSDSDKIIINDIPDEQIIISGTFISCESPTSIAEDRLSEQEDQVPEIIEEIYGELEDQDEDEGIEDDQ